MGRLPTGQRQHHIRHLSPMHHNILEMVALGFDNKRIAETLGVSRQTVSDVKNSAISQPVLASMDSLMEAVFLELHRLKGHFASQHEFQEVAVRLFKEDRFRERAVQN